MTTIFATDWLWQLQYNEKNMKMTEKYKPKRYVVATGNKFEGGYAL